MRSLNYVLQKILSFRCFNMYIQWPGRYSNTILLRFMLHVKMLRLFVTLLVLCEVSKSFIQRRLFGKTFRNKDTRIVSGLDGVSCQSNSEIASNEIMVGIKALTADEKVIFESVLEKYSFYQDVIKLMTRLRRLWSNEVSERKKEIYLSQFKELYQEKLEAEAFFSYFLQNSSAASSVTIAPQLKS
jgi:hypothetical protein